MFIECLGHRFALYLWSFLILFVYQCKREYYLSEFKVVFIIYGELIVSESKCIVRNLMRHLSHGDCSYSLCIRAKNVFWTLWNSFKPVWPALLVLQLFWVLHFSTLAEIVFISVCSLMYCPPNEPVYKNIGHKHIQKFKQKSASWISHHIHRPTTNH